jgi:hypothetical protein
MRPVPMGYSEEKAKFWRLFSQVPVCGMCKHLITKTKNGETYTFCIAKNFRISKDLTYAWMCDQFMRK